MIVIILCSGKLQHTRNSQWSSLKHRTHSRFAYGEGFLHIVSDSFLQYGISSYSKGFMFSSVLPQSHPCSPHVQPQPSQAFCQAHPTDHVQITCGHPRCKNEQRARCKNELFKSQCTAYTYIYIYIYIERERETERISYTYIYIHIYIYIYMYREREREREISMSAL